MSGTLWIKVCGLRSVEAVEAASRAGANAVGFVFHPGSPRNLDPAAARELAATVPAGLEKVAVFLHPSQALLDAALAAVRPDWVQTDAEDFAGLELPAGQKTLPVHRSGATPPTGAGPHARFLFESAHSGAGERADWVAAAAAARTGELVLAGGLHAGNVAEAVAAVRPFGVDVSSGVERSRGIKDATLIREFVKAARQAEVRQR